MTPEKRSAMSTGVGSELKTHDDDRQVQQHPSKSAARKSCGINIPKQLQQPEFRFILIPRREKRPIEKGWQKEDGANYRYDDPKLLQHLAKGGNYGVLCGPGGLVVLDADNVERLEKLGSLKKLPSTFTVRTGSGGLHLYFICKSIEKKRVLYDPKTGEHLGELQSWGSQVVGPGCLHPCGNGYELQEGI